ncbi:Ger(x)C family spore germination protein [Lysinibacillus sp. 3P01SB]|uniref:Ger(x)C family spore germination protein n=1 Tax=Lysinibacillus sp. 3P01SB TaxID=3132284 RepID=UPI0039A4BDC8
MMKKFKVIVLVVVFIVLLGGCAEQKVLEDLSLTTLIGYDAGDEENLTTTAIIRQINPEFESNVETISASARTSKGTREEVSLKASKKVAVGQLRVVVFGEELAKAGLGQSLYTLLMNPEISNGIYLGVVEGEAKSFLEYQYENITDVSQHMFNLLGHNIEREKSISSTLHEVGRDYYSPTRQIVLPIIKREENLIKITGIAFFQNERMVGRLPAKDMFYVKIIRDGFERGTFELVFDGEKFESVSTGDTPDELAFAMDAIKTKKTIKLIDQNTPEYDLNIKISVRLTEVDASINTGDKKTLELLEKEINEKVESEIARIIQYTQDLNSDVFGFGEHFESHVRGSNLTHEELDEMYPNMKVNIHVKSEIVRDGVFGAE